MKSSALQLIVWFALCLATQAQRPNVVFFLVDDLGQRDVGCYGSTFYDTPAIDQLAKEGMLFDNAYSTCHVCSPSRASIQTGKYPGRTDLSEWLGGRPERDYETLHSARKLKAIPDSEQTLAETLKANGYRTAFYGKAHLGKPPEDWGFDESTHGWYRSYHYPFTGRNNGPDGKEGDYLTDRYTDLAVDFIERHKDQPFYLHMAHFAVHDPIHGRKDLVEKYEKKLAAMPKQDGPDYILEGNPDGPPVSADELKAFEQKQGMPQAQEKRLWWVKQKQDNVEFAGMVEAMDESLGRIRAKLKEHGLEKNTIVVFTSDNGGMSASNQYLENNKSRKTLNSRFASSNLPLRGAKGWNYEGGIRVPLIVHWPGRTKANSKSHAVVTGTDYYPTLLEMIGLPAMPEQHVDGRSFVPALNGKAHDRGAIYWHFPHYSNHGYQSPNGAIRLGQYKLIEYYENGGVQLFDLEKDIGETTDISKTHPETAAKLLQMLQRWRKDVDAKMPPVKTAESRKKSPGKTSGKGAKSLPADVKAFAPGWAVRDWGGPNMKPGLRSEWGGRKNVLVTHPKSRTVACVLSRKVDVPAGKTTTLSFAVSDHVKGDWKLVVRVNGKESLNRDIDGTKWQQFRIDLSEHAGKTVALELENQATGWAHEAGFWHSLRIESK
jgi:arylsulfatase A-like enzyme